jgi:hypothetical protein
VAVCFTEASPESVNSVTWNGAQPLNEVTMEAAGGDQETSLWYLGNATAATGDVVISMTANTTGAALGVAIAISGCSTMTPTLDDTDFCSSCATATYSLTSAVNNTLMLTCSRSSVNSGTWTHGTGQTEVADFINTESPIESLTASWELKATAGAETLTDTRTTSGDIRGVAMGIEPFTAPPAGMRRARPVTFK